MRKESGDLTIDFCVVMGVSSARWASQDAGATRPPYGKGLLLHHTLTTTSSPAYRQSYL